MMDSICRPQIMDVLADDLFPASLSIKERCRHWISAFSLFEPLHQKAFNSILSQKRRYHWWTLVGFD